jgi:radical SAM superfamily enzyme YgiQ (UPF0313 family)
MRALLIAVNARYSHSNLAIRYLRNEIERIGRQGVEIREYAINQNELDIIEEIDAIHPDVLLISTYIWNARYLSALLPDLHALLPHCKIILGGPEAGYAPETWLKRFDFISCIIQGPGERAMRLLAENDFNLEAPGILPFITGKLLRVPSDDFKDIPFPYTEEDFTALRGHYLYYESSRGCPFACSYCLSSRQDQSLQEKTAEQTIRELGEILAHRPNIIKFVDRTFNARPRRARQIWDYCSRDRTLAESSDLALRDVRDGETAPKRRKDEYVKFHFEIHPALLEEEDFTLLEGVEAGRFQFEIGIQSTNPSTLGTIHRPVDFEAIKPAVRRLIKAGRVHVHLDLVAGLPNEGMESLGKTFDDVISLRPHQLQLGFLKALPGTELRERAAEYGMAYREAPPYQILKNDWLSNQELAELRLIDNLVDGLYNSRRFGPALERAYNRQGSPFAAFRALVAHCRAIGFDTRTKNQEKLSALLSGWLGQA